MNKTIFTIIAFLFTALTISASEISISGEWVGTRFQYNETKSQYIAEFEYKYNLTQEKNLVKGTAFIQSKGGKYAEIAVRGFIEGNLFYFEEYEVINATRGENFLWCLKKGVLTISEEDGKINLKGATPSFMEFYGYECSGGVTHLSKEKTTITNEEVTNIVNESNTPNLSVYPNPFVETTQLSFSIENTQPVIIDVVDIQGRVIETMENKTLEKGSYNYTFTPKPNMNSPYYYMRIKIGDKTTTRAIQKVQSLGEIK